MDPYEALLDGGIEWPVPGTNPARYQPTITNAAAAQAAFEPVRKLVEETAKFKEQMLPAMESDVFAQQFADCGPLVGRFIGSEFDVDTPGNRGVGRLTDGVPRLGGYFRRQMSPEIEAALGPVIEEVLASGFVITVGMTHSKGDTNAPTLVQREPEEVFVRWIPRIMNSLGRAENFVEYVAPATEPFYEQAKQHLVGPLAIRKRLALSKAANFYAMAGAALFEASTDLT